MELFPFSWRSIFLKWNLFFFTGGFICYTEYFPVFMKQLGITPSQIGWTTLYGIPSMIAFPMAFLADKMRARKSIFAVTTVLFVFLALAPLLPLAGKSLQNCNNDEHNYSINQTTTSAQYNSSDISHTGDNCSPCPWLWIFMVIGRSICETFTCMAITLQDTAIMTY